MEVLNVVCINRTRHEGEDRWDTMLATNIVCVLEGGIVSSYSSFQQQWG